MIAKGSSADTYTSISSFRDESAYNAEYNSSTFAFVKQGMYVTQMKLIQRLLEQRN